MGCGSFGPTHLEAWRRLGLRKALWVADPDPDARVRAAACDIPAERIIPDYREVLREVDVVDVVAATELHVEICLAAIEAGKDVFVEKPLTLVADEARKLAQAVERSGRVLQVGYYFRHHPLTWYARERIRRGELGELRYLSGNFSGFKRARRDVGCTANDAVHFLDLCNWLVGAAPTLAFSVQRDHFGRGLEEPARFRLTAVSRPQDLDACLAAPGYEVEAPTDVLVAKAAPLRRGSTSHPVTIAPMPSPDWTKCWLASGARDEAAKRRALLARLPAATVFALARTRDEPVGIGFAVIERGWAGIFAMQTAAPYRGQGVARAVLDALIARARAAGANRLYLQVEQDNAVAQRLYRGAGFSFAYGYHYRTRGLSDRDQSPPVNREPGSRPPPGPG